MTAGKTFSRRLFIECSGASAAAFIGAACSSSGGDSTAGTGGNPASGGAQNSGGGSNTGGASGQATGGVGTGGTSSSGGAASGGSAGQNTSGSGGSGKGGATGKGGSAGAATGSGGKATGGTGGKASGGSGDKATGGTGGKASGGDAGSGGQGGSSPGTTAPIAVARAATIGQATKDAIALVTGGLSFIKAGSTVLLKPNLNSGDPSPCSPNPEIVRAVIELVRAQGAERVIIGDRSNPSYKTMDAMQKSGILAVAQELEVETIDFDGKTTRRLTPSGATHWPNGFQTYALLLDEVDHIINMPCVKHHGLANFTMSLKAWMGIIVQDDRNTAHSDLGNRLPELHLGVRESFIVLDGSNALLTGGPSPNGKTAKPNLVVATASNVLCDVMGVAIMKYHLAQQGIADNAIDQYSVWEQPQIVRALALGLGLTNKSEYRAVFSGVSEAQAIEKYITG